MVLPIPTNPNPWLHNLLLWFSHLKEHEDPYIQSSIVHALLDFILVLHIQGLRVTQPWTFNGTKNQQLPWIIQTQSLKQIWCFPKINVSQNQTPPIKPFGKTTLNQWQRHIYQDLGREKPIGRESCPTKTKIVEHELIEPFFAVFLLYFVQFPCFCSIFI